MVLKNIFEDISNSLSSVFPNVEDTGMESEALNNMRAPDKRNLVPD